MNERSILFSAPMVRAILGGSKTQTRRVCKPAHKSFLTYVVDCVKDLWGDEEGDVLFTCPYGKPGDRLWVRETWQFYDWTEDGEPCIRFAADNATTWPEGPRGEELVDQWEILSRPSNYNIDNAARDRRWRPSIHMPRWASRIQLEIASVRVERLQDISESDCYDEGAQAWAAEMVKDGNKFSSVRAAWRALWISTGGDWDANPWVWVVEFKRVDAQPSKT